MNGGVTSLLAPSAAEKREEKKQESASWGAETQALSVGKGGPARVLFKKGEITARFRANGKNP